jgi:hypothetical protein
MQDDKVEATRTVTDSGNKKEEIQPVSKQTNINDASGWKDRSILTVQQRSQLHARADRNTLE